MKFFVILLYFFKPKNWLILLGILINVGLMILIGWLFIKIDLITFPLWKTILVIVGIYLVCEFVFTSPLGEMQFRKEYKMTYLERNEDSEGLYRIFDRVYDRAQERSPFVSKKIKLYFVIDKDANAFALGSRTVCITSGLLDLPPNEIEGIIAHEFGHIVNFDSNISLFSIHGNAMLKVFICLIEIPFLLIAFLLDGLLTYLFYRNDVAGKSCTICSGLVNLVAILIINIAAVINRIFFLAQSRIVEYEADEYAYKIGEGENLRDGLKTLSVGYVKPRGILSTMLSSHPNMYKRIDKLNEMIMAG